MLSILYYVSAINHSVASSWFSSLRICKDARTDTHQVNKQKCITYLNYNRHKILAVMILFHTANGLPIKFPDLGDIMNEGKDLDDVWFHVVNARSFFKKFSLH